MSNKDIYAIIKQKPNKKIIGLIPFHIWIYNLSNPTKNNWINTYLRRIGEEPIILDNRLVDKSVSQIKSYFENNGYFTSTVSSNTTYKQQKSYVNYIINTGESYLINNIKYEISEEKDIQKIIQHSLKNSNLKKGNIFTYNSLNEERLRSEKLLQNHGSYKF